jgi:transcription termination factor NusB
MAAAMSLSATTAMANYPLQIKINGVVQIEQSQLDAFTAGVNRVESTMKSAETTYDALMPYMVYNKYNKIYEVNSGLTADQLKMVYMGIQTYNSLQDSFINTYANQVTPALAELQFNRSADLAKLTSLVDEQLVADKWEILKLVETIAEQTKQLEKLKADYKTFSSYPNNTFMASLAAGVKTKITELETAIQKNLDRISYLQNELLANDATLSRIKSAELGADAIVSDLGNRMTLFGVSHPKLQAVPSSQ